MTTIASKKADPLQVLWDEYQSKVAAWEAGGAGAQGDCSESVAMEQAEERFITARTTSRVGILLKLKHIAEGENMAGALEGNPRLTTNRLVVGLIRDLESSLERG